MWPRHLKRAAVLPPCLARFDCVVPPYRCYCLQYADLSDNEEEDAAGGRKPRPRQQGGDAQQPAAGDQQAAAGAAAGAAPPAAPAAAGEKRGAQAAALDNAREKSKKAKEGKPQGWFDLATNTNVYVTGLPEDVTEGELIETFSKCGVIKEDLEVGGVGGWGGCMVVLGWGVGLLPG
jgi:HIV Tat-specific factor 1